MQTECNFDVPVLPGNTVRMVRNGSFFLPTWGRLCPVFPCRPLPPDFERECCQGHGTNGANVILCMLLFHQNHSCFECQISRMRHHANVVCLEVKITPTTVDTPAHV